MSKIQTDPAVAGNPVAPPMSPRADKPAVPRGEQRILLHDIDWATYKRISEALVERHFRLSYDGWNLELMTKSSSHCWLSRLLGYFVLALTEELDVPRVSCGGMTCERDDLERALEPDECFYLVNAARVSGKHPINLHSDPPPDLAIEIDLTTDSRRRFGIYAKIGVPEIWRYDGTTATIHQRQADGQYLAVERSRFFAFLTPADLTRFLGQREQVDETALLRSFREWVRSQINPSR